MVSILVIKLKQDKQIFFFLKITNTATPWYNIFPSIFSLHAILLCQLEPMVWEYIVLNR